MINDAQTLKTLNSITSAIFLFDNLKKSKQLRVNQMQMKSSASQQLEGLWELCRQEM